MRLIAIGSPFRDDDISYRVMDVLKSELFIHYPQLDICYLDRPGMQLVNEIQHADCVILIDAVLSSQQPGSILALQADELDDQHTTFSSHDLSVADAIKLARHLEVLPEQLYIFGISIDPTQTLDKAQFQRACSQLQQQLAVLCNRLNA